MAKKIRGVTFEENLNNSMGLEFYNLSHRFGYQSPELALFRGRQDRAHPLPRQVRRAVAAHHHLMHNTTHIDAPAHVVQGTPFIDEVPLPHFFGSGIVVSIPKKKWEQITYDDLEKAAGKVVRPRDVVIVNTGWHKLYEDSEDYFCRAPGFVPSAGEWFVEKKVKVVGHDTQANDHPLATAIGPQRNGPLHPHLAEEYKKWSGGRDWKDDFPEWEPVHRILFKNGILGIENVGGDSTRSPAGAAPSRSSRGTGSAATAASSGWSPSSTPRAPTGSRRGRSSDDRPQASPRRSPTRRPTTATTSRCACSAPRWAARRRLIFGISHFLPGGGAGPDASPPEKIYYVLAGELTVIVGGKETVAQGGRQLLHRPERKPRDRQPRQRGLHHRGRGRAGEVTPWREQHTPSCAGLTRASTS